MLHRREDAFGRYGEEFAVGDVYRHYPGKTVTEGDHSLFCLLTMNHHPLHLDRAYAEDHPHGRILVAGTYVLSLVAGMSVADISGKALANLGYDAISHDGPVFVGDTLNAESEIVAVRASTGDPDRMVVTVETRAFNQRSERVITMRRSILVPRTAR
jgi:acyl dehydratase